MQPVPLHLTSMFATNRPTQKNREHRWNRENRYILAQGCDCSVGRDHAISLLEQNDPPPLSNLAFAIKPHACVTPAPKPRAGYLNCDGQLYSSLIFLTYIPHLTTSPKEKGLGRDKPQIVEGERVKKGRNARQSPC